MGNKLPKKKINTSDVDIVKPTTEEDTEDTENGDTALNDVLHAAANATANVENDDQTEDNDGEKKDDEATDSPAPAVENDSKKDDNAIIVAKPENTTPPKSPMVDVATCVDHTCSIGGKRYEFKRGVKTSVPRPIKDILKNAGLLMPL